MRRSIWLAAGLALVLSGGSPARAHFLFVHITPVAEAGRAAEVYFSEFATAGDPRFIDRIAHTELWAQAEPGKYRPLTVRKAEDRLRAHLAETGTVAVVGHCTYGVLARPKQTAFLLRHYPKAVAGNPDQLNRLHAGKVPFEIQARFDGDRIELIALRDGKPTPGAVFQHIDADLAGSTVTAGEDGKAVWKPGKPGRYSVYTSATLKTPGEHDGKKYDEIREFTTLAFTWPLERTGGDAAAIELFEDAVAARAQWRDFPGFSARLVGRVDGRPIEGEVSIAANGAVFVESQEEAVQGWVTEQFESIVLHRTAPTGERRRPVLRFADVRDDNPLGPLLLFEGGRFASSYRVKDRQITVVNRHLGKQHMTITVLENEQNADGRYLPRTYTVQYWDADSGNLLKTETVHQRWRRFGEWDLPVEHTVTVASGNGFTVRTLKLSEHRLQSKKK